MGRKSTEKALLNYVEKHTPNHQKQKRTNDKPEKRVEADCMSWLIKNNFSCHIVESKAVYNPKAGRYLNSQTNPGFPDCVGCDPNGASVWIEFKAPGRKSTVRKKQKQNLIDKINNNAFAVIVTSSQELESAYNKWKKLKATDNKEAQKFLYSFSFSNQNGSSSSSSDCGGPELGA